MKELKETIDLMQSADYKERFAAEYYQLETRYLKLKAMVEKWDKGELNFTSTCSHIIYDRQLFVMYGYLNILLQRALDEKVDIVVDDKLKEIINNTDGLDENIIKENMEHAKQVYGYVEVMKLKGEFGLFNNHVK